MLFQEKIKYEKYIFIRDDDEKFALKKSKMCFSQFGPFPDSKFQFQKKEKNFFAAKRIISCYDCQLLSLDEEKKLHK